MLAIPVAAAYTVTRLDDFRSHQPWMDSMLEYSGQTRDAALYVRENFSQDSALYSNHLWPVLAYHSKHKTTALWPRDERFYSFYPKNMEDDGYLVYHRGVEKKPDEEWLNSRPEFKKVAGFGNVVVYSYEHTGAQALGPELVKRIEEAKNYRQDGSYDRVLEVLEPIQIAHVEVADLRGWSYYRMGKIAEAAEAFQRGLRAEPDDPRCLTGLGYSEMRMGQVGMARQRFQQVVEMVPDKTNAWVGLGLAELRLGNRAAAVQAFRQALELSPESNEIQEYLKKAEES